MMLLFSQKMIIRHINVMIAATKNPEKKKKLSEMKKKIENTKIWRSYL